jgi:hypothetical protein
VGGGGDGQLFLGVASPSVPPSLASAAAVVGCTRVCAPSRVNALPWPGRLNPARRIWHGGGASVWWSGGGVLC